jgi:anaerobic ribonucleoside-triphosphate reductase activating protein
MKIKYLRKSIVFQEIPGEISLSLEITNCPHRCSGCHSSELQQDIGIELTKEVLIDLINEHKIDDKYLITCVLFMGGDQHEELSNLLDVVCDCGLKTALYSGNDYIYGDLINYLDYLKLGKYIEELGSLTSETTNQRLYNIINYGSDFYWEEIKLNRG